MPIKRTSGKNFSCENLNTEVTVLHQISMQLLMVLAPLKVVDIRAHVQSLAVETLKTSRD